jgi:putative endonuclease
MRLGANFRLELRRFWILDGRLSAERTVLSRVMFGVVNMAARRGMSGPKEDATGIAGASSQPAPPKKQLARRAGVRGETFAYWYLRRHGYVIVARNFTVAGIHGELDLVGYDGKVLAFVEVKLRTMGEEPAVAGVREALPEDAITPGKKRAVVRMAKNFMATWRLRDVPYRFDVLAIESRAGAKPAVRLHKDAFSARV